MTDQPFLEEDEMQTKDQVRKWKIAAGAASLTAIGVVGVAIAAPSGASSESPPPIELQDARSVSEITNSTTTTLFPVVGGPVVIPDIDDSLDSPLASADLSSPDADGSPDMDQSIDPDDSPDLDGTPDLDDSADLDVTPDVDETLDMDATPDVDDTEV